jgi:hypothetical protein
LISHPVDGETYVISLVSFESHCCHFSALFGAQWTRQIVARSPCGGKMSFIAFRAASD